MNLSEGNLQGAILGGTNLQKSSLINADLREAVLLGANLAEVNLLNSNLFHMKLSHPNSSQNALGLTWSQIQQASSYQEEFPQYIVRNKFT